MMENMQVIDDGIQDTEVSMEQVFQEGNTAIVKLDHTTPHSDQVEVNFQPLHCDAGTVEVQETGALPVVEETTVGMELNEEVVDSNIGHVVQIIMEQEDGGESEGLMSGAHLIQLDTGQGTMQQYLQVLGEDGEKQLIQVETSSDGHTHLVFQEPSPGLLHHQTDITDQMSTSSAAAVEERNLPSSEERTFVEQVMVHQEECAGRNEGVSGELPVIPDTSAAVSTSNLEESAPIKLTSDSEVIINGKKCVLRMDEATGQLVAFPVKPTPTGKRRGRPRKMKPTTDSLDTLTDEHHQTAEPALTDPIPDEELDTDKESSAVEGLLGLSELEDGRRRSNRAKKKNTVLAEYETGAIEGVEDDIPDAGTRADGPAVPPPPGLAVKSLTAVKRGPGRPAKASNVTNQLQNFLASLGLPVKRGRGRPRRRPAIGATTSFLLPSGAGQAVVMAPLDGLSLPKLQNKLINIQAKETTETPLLSKPDMSSATESTLTDPAVKPNFTLPHLKPTVATNISAECTVTSTPHETGPLGAHVNTDFPAIIVKNADGSETHIYASPNNPLEQVESGVQSGTLLQDSSANTESTEIQSDAIPEEVKVKEADVAEDEEINDMTQEMVLKNEDAPEVDDVESEQVGASELLPDQPPQGDGKLSIDKEAEDDKCGVISSQDPEAITVSFIDGAEKTEGEEERPPTAVIQLPQHLVPLLIPRKEPPKIGLRASEGELAKLKCPKCSFQAYYTQQFNEHLTKHADELHRCKCCSLITLSQDQLVQHFREFHPRNICPTCDFMAEQVYAVKRHVVRHNDPKGRECEICGKVYKDQYVLKMHIKLVHMPADVLFECNICSKKFTRKAHLKRHLRIHEPEKPYKCPHCDYRGCERSDITKHVPIHEAPKYTCEVCNKSFRHLKNKELHLKRHKGQRDYKCGVCDFYGYTFTDIRKHIERKHSDSRHFYCCKCGIYFRTESALREHRQRTCDGCLSVGMEMTVSDTADVGEEEVAETLSDHVTVAGNHVLVDTHPNNISIEQVPVLTETSSSVTSISEAEFIEAQMVEHMATSTSYHGAAEIADITEIINTQESHTNTSSSAAAAAAAQMLDMCQSRDHKSPRSSTSGSPLPAEHIGDAAHSHNKCKSLHLGIS